MKESGRTLFDAAIRSASTVHGAHPTNTPGSVRFISRKDWDSMIKANGGTPLQMFQSQHLVVVGAPDVPSMRNVTGWNEDELEEYLDLDALRDTIGEVVFYSSQLPESLIGFPFDA